MKFSITDEMIVRTGDCGAMDAFDARQISPLTLAWIGDAVYEVVVRNMLVRDTGIPGEAVNRLNRKARSLVNAGTQSAIIGVYEDRDILTEDEQKVYHRGRNAKSNTHAKNASIQDYRRATGFEAVMGYLWLTGQTDRIIEIVRAGFEGLKENGI